MTTRRATLLSWAALATGALLFVITLTYVDFGVLRAGGTRLAIAVLGAIAMSGAWHLTRTFAWAWCFPRPRAVGFARLARVRLAAEAFSYLTLRGIAGEPLKVILLRNDVDMRDATAAVALERLAYMIGTTFIVGIGSVAAIVVLPLSPAWVRVFRGFAIGSAVVTVLAGLALKGRGTYLGAGLRRLDRRLNTHLHDGRVGRFAADVERRLIELVRGNRRRLFLLIAATLAAYVLMCLEAWTILRAMGFEISFLDAMTIETFSRVASFASAFIPANLGALEAASVAAVSAIGAGPAGAPLAIARRVRGLFWAGTGLVLYPRRGNSSPVPTTAVKQDDGSAAGPTLLYVPVDPAVRLSPFARVAGLPIAERVLRSAFSAQYRTAIVLVDDTTFAPMQTLARQVDGHVRLVKARDWRHVIASLGEAASVTAIGAGTVVSPALLKDAATTRTYAGESRDVAAGPDWPLSGVIRLQAADAVDLTHVSKQLEMRLRDDIAVPSGDDLSHGRGHLVLRMRTDAERALGEQTIRRASYKTTDNTVARFNRRLSVPLSVMLIRTPLTPNQLSIALVALGFYAAWLFSAGHYATNVLAAFLSLAASILDGCDGEIARLKYQQSALGCWIETIGDYSYYLAIFVGMTVGSVRLTRMPILYWFGSAALAGTLITFVLLIFLRSRITNGQPENLHAIAKARFKAVPTLWSRVIWRISFVATRSTMPYGIAVLALLGFVPLVVVLAAVGANAYWISLVLKLKHLLASGRAHAHA